MTIKNTALIFDLLNNKLSGSKTIEAIECFYWTNSNSKAGVGPILSATTQK